MKKLILIVILMVPFMLMAQKGLYTINGKVGSINPPAKVYLSHRNASNVVMDSTTITNGQFQLKGTITDPEQASLIVNYTGARVRGAKTEVLSLYLEPGIIKITSPDSLKKATIIGGKVNADNEKLKNALLPTDKLLNDYMAEYRAVPADKKKDEAINAALDKKYDEITEVKKKVYLDFINKNPTSFISLIAIQRAVGSVPDYSDIAPLFNSLSANVKNTEAAKTYAATLAKLKATGLGQIAPEFSQNDAEGNPIKLSDFRGKYLLIDFWASWCGPCRGENPNVVKAYAKYHDKGFEILGISLDSKKEAWIKAIADDKLSWKHVSDLKYWNNEVGVLYAVRAIPQNFLLDPKGVIVGKNLRGEALNKKLAELFGE